MARLRRSDRGRWVDVHSDDINEFVREIAGLTCYVDPRLIDRYLHGETVVGAVGALGAGVEFHPATQGALEAAVLDLLDPQQRSGDDAHETAERLSA